VAQDRALHRDELQHPAAASRNPDRGRLRALLREPLFQFLLVGALFFAGSRFFETEQDAAERNLVIGAALEQRLAKLYAMQMGVLPARAQLDELVENYVHEEVLYREALRMGLAQDDEIVRRRLIQKLEFLSSDLAAATEPTDAMLRAYYDANVSHFTSDPVVTFEHVYFSPDFKGAAAARDRARAALVELTGDKHSAKASGGDLFPLQSTYARIDRAGAVQVFGRTAIVDAIFAKPLGEWWGPVQSGYGWHLIRITNRAGKATQSFAAVRDRVRQMYLQEQTEAAKRNRYEQLRARYVIVREPGPPRRAAR
jgi:peptidyl-prolyl cis-trans isomerase C